MPMGQAKWDVYPYLILLFVYLELTSIYFCYSLPGALYTQLRTWFGPGEYYFTTNNILYTIVNIPVIIASLFSSFIIQTITGRWNGMAVFSFIIFLGQGFFSLGVQFRVLWMLFAGRFLFGVGVGVITIVSYQTINRWTPEGKKALWIAIIGTTVSVGLSVGFFMYPVLANSSLIVAVWFAFVAGFLVTLSCSVVAVLDYTQRSRFADETLNLTILNWRSIKKIKPHLFLLLVVEMLYVPTSFAFFTVGSVILQNTGLYSSPQGASTFLSIINFVRIFTGPYVGWMYDHHGRGLIFILAGTLSTIIPFSLLLGNAYGIWRISPIPIMLLTGFCDFLVTSVILPVIFKCYENVLVIYGIVISFENLAQSIYHIILSALKGNLPGLAGYTIQLLLFMGVCFGAGFLTTIDLFLDKICTGGKMNFTPLSSFWITHKGEDVEDHNSDFIEL